MSVLTIVPRLPPTVDGVGDYALNLARQLRLDFQIETHFIVGDPAWQGDTHLEGFAITKLDDRSKTSLLSLLQQLSPTSPVLLHYVGYGYAKRGCPTWLIETLTTWKLQTQTSHLVTVFHEISANGPMWTSAFWLSKVQLKLATDLVKISDYSHTSLAFFRDLLSQLAPRQDSVTFNQPVFSSVGELTNTTPWPSRQKHLVIFGTYGRRLPIYKNHYKELERVIRNMEIEEVLDIGKPLPLPYKDINGVPIKVLGKQSSSVIQKLLQTSIAGVIDYPAEILAKSTIFAAYCAHQMLPIVVGTQKPSQTIDGLTLGHHYWCPEWQAEQLDLEVAESISQNAYAWYQHHTLSKQAQIFFNYLNTPYKKSL